MKGPSEADQARTVRGTPRPTRALAPLNATRQTLRTLKAESQFAPEVSGAPLDLAAYWRALVRRRWTVLASLLVALAIGAAVTLLMRPIYTAEATLQIDREAEKVVSRDEATPADNLAEEFYQTQYGLLRSRALAERGGSEPWAAGQRRLHRQHEGPDVDRRRPQRRDRPRTRGGDHRAAPQAPGSAPGAGLPPGGGGVLESRSEAFRSRGQRLRRELHPVGDGPEIRVQFLRPRLPREPSRPGENQSWR